GGIGGLPEQASVSARHQISADALGELFAQALAGIWISDADHRSEQTWQLGGSFCAQGDEVDRLAPCGRLLGTASCHHLVYHGGQDGVGMLPASSHISSRFPLPSPAVQPGGESWRFNDIYTNASSG